MRRSTHEFTGAGVQVVAAWNRLQRLYRRTDGLDTFASFTRRRLAGRSVASYTAPNGARTRSLESVVRRPGVVEIILTEFGRAIAAERRYEDLKYGRASRDGLASAEISKRIFQEFYARQDDTVLAALKEEDR